MPETIEDIINRDREIEIGVDEIHAKNRQGELFGEGCIDELEKRRRYFQEILWGLFDEEDFPIVQKH